MKISRITVVLILLATSAVEAGDVVVFKNDTDQFYRVWIYPYSQGEFLKPLRISPGRSESFEFNSGEDYYIVAVDRYRRETPFGKFNISELCKKHPSPVIQLSVASPTSSGQMLARGFDGRWYAITPHCRPDTDLVPFWRVSSRLKPPPAPQ